MQHQTQILKRLAYVEAELVALERMVDLWLDEVEVELPVADSAAVVVAPLAVSPDGVAAPAPADATQEGPAPVESVKPRWSYLPGTSYRLVGPSPFREGNHFNLFAHLEATFADQPFTREQLGDAVGELIASGAIVTQQDEDAFVVSFLQRGGLSKGRVEMVAPAAPPVREREAPLGVAQVTLAVAPEVEDAPQPEAVVEGDEAHAEAIVEAASEGDEDPAEVGVEAAAEEDEAAVEVAAVTAPTSASDERLPPEPGDRGASGWLLVGDSPFRAGSIPGTLWGVLQEVPFTREDLVGVISELLMLGELKSSRTPAAIAREFLGEVADRGAVERV